MSTTDSLNMDELRHRMARKVSEQLREMRASVERTLERMGLDEELEEGISGESAPAPGEREEQERKELAALSARAPVVPEPERAIRGHRRDPMWSWRKRFG